MTIAILSLVVGCSHQLRRFEMPVEAPASFSTNGTKPLPEKWWQEFEDQELNRLVEQALTDNFTLQTTWDRLAQAQAIAEKADATLKPQVDLYAGASRSRQENNLGTTYSSLYSAGVAASYEVDLWSRLGSLKRAALLDVEAGRDAVDTAAISLAAAIADTWYQLAEAKKLLRIAKDQTQSNKKVLRIVTAQFRKGFVSAADMLRQRQLVASTEAQMITSEETVQLLQYKLSVLIGEKPSLRWQKSSITLPDLSPIPDLGLPSEVLWRRPDVRRDHKQVQAANQRLAAAIIDQYPRISLSAQAETSSSSVRDLFDDWLANLAANLIQPLLDGNQRRAEVQKQEAVVSETVHNWGQTLLDALQETEDSLTREQQQTKLLENLRLQLDLASQTYQRNRQSYIKGKVDYIRVLESLVSMQTLERSVVTAQRILIQNRIDLYRSVAGGFDMPQPKLAQLSDTAKPTNPGNAVKGE